MTPQPQTLIEDGTEEYRIVKHRDNTNFLVRRENEHEPAIFLDREDAEEELQVKREENPDTEYRLFRTTKERVTTNE